MDDEIIEGILFLKPNGLPLDKIKDQDINELVQRLNTKYEKTVLNIVIKNNRLIMEIKPEYIDKIATYYDDKDLSDRQIKVLGLLRMNGKMAKSEIRKRLSNQELLDLLNRNFIKIEKLGRREFIVLGPGYYQYFNDKNVKN